MMTNKNSLTLPAYGEVSMLNNEVEVPLSKYDKDAKVVKKKIEQFTEQVTSLLEDDTFKDINTENGQAEFERRKANEMATHDEWVEFKLKNALLSSASNGVMNENPNLDTHWQANQSTNKVAEFIVSDKFANDLDEIKEYAVIPILQGIQQDRLESINLRIDKFPERVEEYRYAKSAASPDIDGQLYVENLKNDVINFIYSVKVHEDIRQYFDDLIANRNDSNELAQFTATVTSNAKLLVYNEMLGIEGVSDEIKMSLIEKISNLKSQLLLGLTHELYPSLVGDSQEEFANNYPVLEHQTVSLPVTNEVNKTKVINVVQVERQSRRRRPVFAGILKLASIANALNIK